MKSGRTNPGKALVFFPEIKLNRAEEYHLIIKKGKPKERSDERRGVFDKIELGHDSDVIWNKAS